MKKGFLKSDWFYGLIISILFFLIGPSDFIHKVERMAYDQGINFSSKQAGDDIAVIAIDDQSIENLGRWPWPRDIIAGMIDRLNAAGAKVIGSTILLSESQQQPSAEFIDGAMNLLQDSDYTVANDENVVNAMKLLKGALLKMDTDSVLAKSMQDADSLVLGMQFNVGQPLGKPDEDLPGYVTSYQLPNVLGDSGNPAYAVSAKPPIESLGSVATGIGHLNFPLDRDGGVRTELLVLDYYGEYYPSLALMIAAKSLNLTAEDILVKKGESVSLANLEIKTDIVSRMYPFFYQDGEGKPAFKVTSFYDVFTDKISPDVFKDKIVIIGATAYGVGTSFVTPIDENMPPAVVLANVTASILNQDFFIIPSWALITEILAFLAVALFLILVLPKLSARIAALASLGILILLIGSSIGLMVTQGLWVQLMLPALLLAFGYLLLITKRFLVTERGKQMADAASAESKRTLGLALQQQGQLDMAWDKFQSCPMDESMLEPIYNLALDFESKRQFNKAGVCYDHIVRFDKSYKDVSDRIKRSKAMEDTFMFGAPGAASNASLLFDETGAMQKPKLGKFEVEKELGKGAMGVVYLAKDPVINRQVAIKTMALAQEFEEDEVDEAKSRFFREAETAGRLNHPNIVSIYDVGEEHDLAFIAMEFLEGHDLARYTKKDTLLPITKVMSIITLSAEALDYAHSENVVHRDIKPANIMYVPESSKIKITDFGIARITDSSKTKTGMVLGTPSYMSPEQLSGKKVDGRSDLFSLGVMLYQMLTGVLPFKGDSMATLMYMIANDPHPDIHNVRPEIVNQAPCVVEIINKSLEKNPDLRYQTGKEMSMALRRCLKSLKKQ